MSYIYTHGSGTVEDPYQIWTAADLNGVRDYLSAHFIQMADINLSSWGNWIPIGETFSTSFTGLYNGNDFKIDHLQDKSLFGYGQDCVITNTHITNATVADQGILFQEINIDNPHEPYNLYNCSVQGSITNSGTNAFTRIGGLGTILYCSFPVKVKDLSANIIMNLSVRREVGGMFAQARRVTLEDCTSTGIISISEVTSGSSAYIGGLIGDLSAAGEYGVSGCSSSCDIEVEATGNDFIIGGLIGEATGPLSNCYATGNVILITSNNYRTALGGLIGNHWGEPPLEDCYATGNVSGGDYSGGLIGTLSSWYFVKACYATGNVDGNTAGGLIGRASSEDCIDSYAKGKVTGLSVAGGLIGQCNCIQVINCYSVGEVNAPTKGGLIGSWGSDNCFNCYYDSQTSGCSDTGKGEPRTTAEMTYPYSDPENVFINWAFYEENEDWVWVHDKPENKYDVTCTITDNNFIIDTCLVYGSNRAFCEYRYLAYLLHQEAYWDDYNLIFAGYDLTEHIKEYDDIVYLPVRYIAQDLLKLRVNWDETNQQLHIAGSVFGPINNGYPHFTPRVAVVIRYLTAISGGTVSPL